MYSYHEGEDTLERGFAPLLPTLPLPLIREGGQGDRLLNDLAVYRLDKNKPATQNASILVILLGRGKWESSPIWVGFWALA
jgi:hypothetical protein